MPTINPGLPTESYYPDPHPKLPSRKELESQPVSERAYSWRLREMMLAAAEDCKLAARIRNQAARAKGQLWTTGDGSHVRVESVSDSHLFYGIAKARRGEYPDSIARRTGVAALEAEALRRLAGL